MLEGDDLAIRCQILARQMLDLSSGCAELFAWKNDELIPWMAMSSLITCPEWYASLH